LIDESHDRLKREDGQHHRGQDPGEDLANLKQPGNRGRGAIELLRDHARLRRRLPRLPEREGA
jgi:hypothetical protein